MARTPEGKVKDAISAVLRERGIWYFLPANNGFGKHGIPDYICCLNGKFLAIEAKAPGKRSNTSELQDHTISDIKGHNGLAVVIDDVSQLEAFLNEL
ncbi:hypothetical protein ACO0LG_08520 [Undibacterium sp. Ji42W]|uniref:hypothetical protein n=1 Tax=Undibacterium sp. Ji42W TaxID=3413039 RepID=UPI003BF28643